MVGASGMQRGAQSSCTANFRVPCDQTSPPPAPLGRFYSLTARGGHSARESAMLRSAPPILQ
eukprot:338026-Prymnesium_polylepis.1